MKKRIFGVVLNTCLVFGGISSAQAQLSMQTFSAFTACDAGFFVKLNEERPVWNGIAPLHSMGRYSWIAVSERQSDSRTLNSVRFSAPLSLAGLNAYAYLDRIDEQEEQGRYYYWGFNIEGSADEVFDTLRPFIKDADRLRKLGDIYARTEVYDPEQGWEYVDTEIGPVGMSRTERVLIIENDCEHEGMVCISCSLQGNAPETLMRMLRPDIGAEHK